MPWSSTRAPSPDFNHNDLPYRLPTRLYVVPFSTFSLHVPLTGLVVSTGQQLNPPRSLQWMPKHPLGLFRDLETPIERTDDPRSPTAFSQISPQLVDEILLYPEGDKKAVLSCALVSRLWIPSVGCFFPFLHFLTTAPVVCGYVRALTLNGCFLFTRNNICSHLRIRLLSTLPSLKQLKMQFLMHCTHFDHPSPFPTATGLLSTLSKSRE